MIVPIRCVTCGKVLADKWLAYERMCAELDGKGSAKDEGGGGDAAAASGSGQKSARGLILDKLGLTRGCCRTVMLTHVDLSMVI
jgi:DNA-directed RNA polymerase I, II, and III subunit RPABC5